MHRTVRLHKKASELIGLKLDNVGVLPHDSDLPAALLVVFACLQATFIVATRAEFAVLCMDHL
ncbi:hypothetical protein I7I48_01829 [Histoplasma ohiense]|nr:hypothetical protein I7I48_01829 [Histoplasma ohiense (nom. inval.)]